MDQSYQDRYFALLQAYVSRPEEGPLASASALERELLVADITLEEVVELHEKTINRMGQQFPNRALLEANRRVSVLLMELFMAYSLAWRKRLESHKQLEETLRSAMARGLVGQMLCDLMVLGGSSEISMHRAVQKLAVNSRAETLSQALSTFNAMGLGKLTLVETDETRRRWTFMGHDLMEVNKDEGQPTCHYTQGFLRGAVQQMLGGADIADTEATCQSMADATSRFALQLVSE